MIVYLQLFHCSCKCLRRIFKRIFLFLTILLLFYDSISIAFEMETWNVWHLKKKKIVLSLLVTFQNEFRSCIYQLHLKKKLFFVTSKGVDIYIISSEYVVYVHLNAWIDVVKIYNWFQKFMFSSWLLSVIKLFNYDFQLCSVWKPFPLI